MASVSLIRAEIDGATVALTWSDDYSTAYHFIWLRDNCRCESCGEPSTGRRSLKLSALDLNVEPDRIRIESESILHVTWVGGHESQFSAVWLRNQAYDDASRRARVFSPVLWDDTFRASPPIMDFRSVDSDDTAFLDMLYTVRDHGLCFLKGAMTGAGTLAPFAEKIGFIQESNFGRVQDLVVDHNKLSVGNRAIALKPHTDEPYRASPSGILLFHCIDTDLTGAGSSIFMDGFEIAETLRVEDPEGFAVLSRNRQMFRRHFADDVDLIAEFPVVSEDEFGNITGVRINDRVAAPISITPNDVPVYYRAMQRLLQLAEDEEKMIRLTLQPGDVVIFDNHRVLHGRTDLTVTGKRWLQWIQVERGDFHSTMRISEDRLHRARSNDPFLRGAYS